MRSIIVALAVLTVMGQSSASAFDGERKGFIIGAAAGISPYGRVTPDHGLFVLDQPVEREGAGTVSWGYMGWCWNKRDMVVGLLSIVGYQQESIDFDHTFAGVAWFHYFRPTPTGLFSIIALGGASYDTGVTCPADVGPGYLLGGGYEFSSHWHFGAAVSGGRSEIGFVNLDQFDIMLFFGGVLF
ncbi:MAG: hypothetical protein RBT76_00600 [candidate division Zixibacteria bacterium]|jgi:hypothetical protein|nr:hypothetical protein [candidate division Zixibacteria bacterium]